MIPLGAIKLNTSEYVYPKIANKIDKYECPECHRELILRQGNIRIHHFAHCKQDDPCNYYTKPTESQIHKNAKMLLKQLLENKKPIVFIRTCRCCNKYEEYEIPEIDMKSKIEIEYRFEYNGLKIADVAYTDDNDIVCLFEIYHTHKTKNENRPEPWFEINASSFICDVNTNNVSVVKIHCIRRELCEECIEKNKCKGNGECFYQTNNGYSKNQDYQCSFNCHLRRCRKYNCKETGPQWYFDCKDGLCISCDMDLFFKYREKPIIYLDVPFSSKDIVKRLGAKFGHDGPYKKWFIPNDHKNKDEILSKFKEWKCPY